MGIPPQHQNMRGMTSDILAAHGALPFESVGVNWLPRFLKRSGVLSRRLAKPRDCNHARFETPEKFRDWFDRAKRTMNDFGIVKQNVYNFDETGFSMGILGVAPVITGTEAREDSLILQPGNRERVNLIECIGASGAALPPLIIFKGKRIQV